MKKKKTSQLRHIFCNQSLERQSMEPMSSGLCYALVQSVEYWMPLFMVFVELIHNGFREENLHTIEASVSYFILYTTV